MHCRAYLLGRLNGYGILLRDGDLHRFGRVALFALDGSPELRKVSTVDALPARAECSQAGR